MNTMRMADWPWKSAAEVKNPELSYWLHRAEHTFDRDDPARSAILARAVKVELNALLTCVDKGNLFAVRFFAPLLAGSVMFTLLGGRDGIIELLDADWGVPFIIALVVVWLGSLRLFWRWVGDRFAHREVLARYRLHHWLAMPSADSVDRVSGSPTHGESVIRK